MTRESASGARTMPIAVTIAGSDSSGGAGIQADLKTFAALGVYGASVITALTAQNTRRVFSVHDAPAEFVAAQIDAVYSDLKVAATKIGMLSRVDTVIAVSEGLGRQNAGRLVLDPVMIATTGARLLSLDATEVLVRRLFPRADLITPNLHEAAALLGRNPAEGEVEMAQQARDLVRLGARAALVKGGHASGPDSVDILFDGSDVLRFPGRRVATRNTHGTGCTLSSAIAAELAKGADLPSAIRAARSYLAGALAAAYRLKVGSGPGPVDHFYAWAGLTAATARQPGSRPSSER
jgi:hydroxymethylpyrimidine/phosphomethylpyrimidine kinase